MKNFLFLLLTVTLMLFVSYNVRAESDGAFPAGKNPGPEETNPFQSHVEANSRGSIQTAVTNTGSSTAENVVLNYDCPSCKKNILRNDSTGVVLDSSGQPIQVEEENAEK